MGFWASGGVPKTGLSALMEDIQTAHSGQPKTGSDTSILIIEAKAPTDSRESPLKGTFSGLLSRKAELVRRARAFGDYLSEIDPDRAEKLKECGGWLLFRDYVDQDVRRLSGGLFCQQRLLCPFCASRISARRATDVSRGVGVVLDQHPHLAPYMVTLTMKSMADRREMVVKFWDAWARLLRRRRRATHGRGQSVMGLMAGGFMNGEAKLGRGGMPHYHGHGIFFADKRMRYKPVWQRLVREWAGLLGQDHASVQFEPVKGLISGGVKEATKYAVKFDDTDFDDRVQWFHALHRKGPTFRKFGVMRKLKLSDDVTDDLSDLEFERFVEKLYSYSGGSYREVRPIEPCEILSGWNDSEGVGQE